MEIKEGTLVFFSKWEDMPPTKLVFHLGIVRATIPAELLSVIVTKGRKYEMEKEDLVPLAQVGNPDADPTMAFKQHLPEVVLTLLNMVVEQNELINEIAENLTSAGNAIQRRLDCATKE